MLLPPLESFLPLFPPLHPRPVYPLQVSVALISDVIKSLLFYGAFSKSPKVGLAILSQGSPGPCILSAVIATVTSALTSFICMLVSLSVKMRISLLRAGTPS